ncbi:MAG TPA: trigger factor [Erysipelotrichaceae bacterium]|nr:trigger factor [Erysipelotrichaceae bacterium]
MKSTINQIENSQVELFVEVEGDLWKEAQAAVFKKAAQNLEVDGFRKGKAPEAIAKKHIRNEHVMMDAVEDIAQSALIYGIEEHKLELVTNPELHVEAISDTQVKLKFVCTVAPEVTLGEYKDLGIEKAEVTVSDTEVEEELEQMREQHAELVLKDGKLEDGDTAVFDFKGFKDDVAFEGGEAENYSLEIGSGQFIPGFEEKMVGMEAGEERDIDLTFPEEYQVEELKGQDVVFKVTLHEVKERQVPELDDDFALDTETEGVETLEDLKENVRKTITERKDVEADRELENDILTKVVEGAKVDIPEVMIDQETDRLYQDMKMRIEQQGIPFDQFMAMTGQDDEAMRDNLKLDAEKQVKLRLVLDKISEVEEMEVSDEEVVEEYEKLSEAYNMELEEIKNAIDEENIKYDLRIRKAYEFVKESN